MNAFLWSRSILLSFFGNWSWSRRRGRLRVRPGPQEPLSLFRGDGLGLAAPFRWPDTASNRFSIKLLCAIGRLAGSGGVGEGVAAARKFGNFIRERVRTA